VNSLVNSLHNYTYSTVPSGIPDSRYVDTLS
jgi:hypothetical protein